MSIAEKKTRVSVQEYLNYLASIEGRAEYYQGVIYDMAGSSDEHSQIALNFGTALNIALRDDPCRVYGADSILAIDADDCILMPDVHVVCGGLEPSHQDVRLHANAILAVEVLSKSTHFFDRTRKFDKYKMLTSLRDYILVEQTEPRVEVYSLNSQGKWEHTAYRNLGEVVLLNSIQQSIRRLDIYWKVQFPKDEEE
jgi:Uma2 family endonuclease